MNQQQKNKQKDVLEFPENLKNQIVYILERPLEKVEYKSTFFKFESGKNHRIDVFVVNENWVIRTYDRTELLGYSTLEEYKEKNKLFGERVRKIMKETGVPWEIGKLALSNNCSLYAAAVEDCKDFLDAKEEIKNSTLRKEAYKENKFVAILSILKYYGLNHKYNLKDKTTFSTLRKFLFEV